MRLWVFAVSLLCLCACSSLDTSLEHAQGKIDEAERHIKQQKLAGLQQYKNIRIIDGYYAPPLSLNDLERPAWWFESVPLINTQDMPLKDLMAQLAKEYAISYQFTLAELGARPVTVSFSGSLGALLNHLSSLLNLHFSVKNEVIVWKAQDTRIFDISFMPGSSQYQLGGAVTTDSSDVALSSSLENQDANTQENESQTTNYAMKSDVWTELKEAIGSMVSPNATFTISPSSSTLTVQDAPWKLDAIESYVNALNDKLSQQIYIDVQVIEVRVNNGENYGINWNIVKEAMSAGGVVGFNSNFSTNAFDTTAPATLSAVITDPTSQYVNSAVLIDALEQQGEVSVVSSPRIVTLNNQMAEIAITEQITYLASSSSRTTANVGAETTLRPGVVETGLQLYVLPLLMEDEALLQVFGTFSTLQDIATVESNDSRIQAPNIRNKRIMQKTKVKLGDTMMLAGFKDSRNQVKKSGLLGQAWLSGSRSYDQQSSEMLILISPHVLGHGGGNNAH